VYGIPVLGIEAMRWTSRVLSVPEIERLSSWPPKRRLAIDEVGDVLFCHATPANDMDIFTKETPAERLVPVFEKVAAPLVVCGHTHMQFDRMIGGTRVVNAGSVGMPFGEPGAYWLLLGPDVELRRTTYDLEAAAARIRDTRYPQAASFAEEHVLAPQAETYLYQAVQFSGWGFRGRPLVLLIIAVTVLSIWLSLRKRPGDSVAASVHTEGTSALAGPGQVWPQVAFAMAAMAAFAFAIGSGLAVSLLAAIFPIAIGLVGLAATGLVLLPLLRGKLATSANFDAELAPRAKDVRGGAWAMLAWLAAFVAAIALVGFFAALIVFFVVFLRVMARISWARIALLTGAACAFMLVLIQALNLVLPGGLAQAYFDLPWPFR